MQNTFLKKKFLKKSYSPINIYEDLADCSTPVIKNKGLFWESFSNIFGIGVMDLGFERMGSGYIAQGAISLPQWVSDVAKFEQFSLKVLHFFSLLQTWRRIEISNYAL